MKFIKFLGHLITFIFLTILTQVGGLIWILAVLLCKKWKLKKRFVFPLLYLVFNLVLIPPIAKQLGRVKLPVYSNKILKPKNIFYPLLFRNYVKPELKGVLEETALSLEKKFSEGELIYLDANFPFINGFPLLPHLSHNDGEKVDLSFFYLDENSHQTNKKPNFIGYGVFEHPKKGEINTTSYCKENGYWQYDYSKFLSFNVTDLTFDKSTTKFVLEEILENPLTQKVFIEPHLKNRLNLTSNKVRFHGCSAVRHDDHIHLQTN